MSDPTCPDCSRPSHLGPCCPEVTGPLVARIAELERERDELQAALDNERGRASTSKENPHAR